jgi:hypothetical protein
MNKVVPFSCYACAFLNKSYVGDGFDEFWEWRCTAKNNKLVGHDEPFSSCNLPKWCPRLKLTLKKLTK